MELSTGEVERFRAGDPELFARIVERYQHGVYQLCLRMLRDRDEAQDLAQECFLRIYRKAALYDPAFPLTPWVYRLATRVTLNHLDQRKRRPSRPLEDADQPTARGPEARAEAIEREEAARVHAALDRLGPDDACILRLRYLGELDLAGVAQALGITVQATKTRLFRARARLKELIEEGGGER